MLELLGTIGGNILSLPGILGLAFGMMTRQLWLAALIGGLVGVVETLVFADMSFANVTTVELVISILVGVAAGCLGCAIRRKGATV
ncbi:hypothetical protein EI983_01325 [Roseovarius faecimaris]|uniref:Uncharacterized protein n=1 Tax=Roseovarius faecimaris TaxID=2494550 RepID=A0A6I6ILN4_9RHOB|nr:hypothetical protein [Roseovarius faecimaris]QGX96984.1 hypothetical protein EI983_01325 [Roseovarius faecimaris]